MRVNVPREAPVSGLSNSDIIVLTLFVVSVLFVIWIRRK
jgi:hypothetical protein